MSDSAFNTNARKLLPFCFSRFSLWKPCSVEIFSYSLLSNPKERMVWCGGDIWCRVTCRKTRNSTTVQTLLVCHYYFIRYRQCCGRAGLNSDTWDYILIQWNIEFFGRAKFRELKKRKHITKINLLEYRKENNILCSWSTLVVR